MAKWTKRGLFAIKRKLALGLAWMLAVLFLAACNGEGPAIPANVPSSQSESSMHSEPHSRTVPQQSMNINMLTGGERPADMEEGARPVAVSIVNNQRALPQRGVAAADVVYEMETEGGITRLMALYADYRTLPQVGPVRSTRDQFVQMALPNNAIMAHIGASVYARNLLTVLDYKVIDGIYLGSTSFYFDEARAHPKPEGKLNEYCWYTNAELLWNGMTAIDVWTNGEVSPLFLFADDTAGNANTAHKVSVVFSQAMGASFTFNEETGLYYKNIVYNQPTPAELAHADEDGTQLAFRNLILLTCPVGLKPDGQVTEFDLDGGEGWYFTAGGMQKITWEKGNPQNPLLLYDGDGNMLQVQRGKSYIGVVNENIDDSVTFISKQELAVQNAT
jgi:hypothetical protein